MCLLQSAPSVIVENIALFLHISAASSSQTASLIKEFALNSGILLQHFYSAIFSPLGGQQFLSRYLCSLWMSGPPDCAEKQLLKRIVPPGFLPYLAMPALSEAGKSFIYLFFQCTTVSITVRVLRSCHHFHRGRTA